MFKRLRQKNEFKDSLDTTEWAWSRSIPKREFASKKKGGEENKIKYFGGKYKWSIHSRSVKKSFLVKNLKHTQTQTYLKDEPW